MPRKTSTPKPQTLPTAPAKQTRGCMGRVVLWGGIVVGLLLLCGIAFSLVPGRGTQDAAPTATPDTRTTATETAPPADAAPDTRAAAVALPTEDTATTPPTATPIQATPIPLTALASTMITSSDGWRLAVENLYLLDAIATATQRHRPTNGVYLVVLGTLTNQTDANGCIKGGDFTVQAGGATVRLAQDLLDQVKALYGRDYPGFFRGQCLDYDARAPTVLLFDVPTVDYLTLQVQDAALPLGLVPDLRVGLRSAPPTATPTPVPTATATATATPTATATLAPTATNVPPTSAPTATKPPAAAPLLATKPPVAPPVVPPIVAPTATNPPPTAAPPTQAPAVPPPATPMPYTEIAQVTRIVDGDTIEVTINGQSYRVRYILINTPETDEPYGSAATAANAALVAGKTVYLLKDVSQTDRYQRLLRYVYLPDGTFVNRELVRQGWAQVATFPPDIAQEAVIRAAQQEAMAAGRGLWGAGDAAAVVAQTTPVVTAAQPAAAQTTANTNANLRAGPGTNYAVVGGVQSGAALAVTGVSADGQWVQLAAGMWIAASLVDGALGGLPLVAGPVVAAPAAAPTVAPGPDASTRTDAAVPLEPAAGAALRIVAVDKRAEYVVVRNDAAAPVNLRGWTLLSEKGSQAWTVPFDFMLQPGSVVTIHALTGQDDAANLYSGFEGNIWNNSEPDAAVLIDPGGVEVGRY